MKNFDLRKYLAEGRLLTEGDFGVNLETPEKAASFKDYLSQKGIPAEVDGIFVEFDESISIDDMRKVSVLADKFLGTSQDSSPFKYKKPSDTITLAVDKAYYDDDKGEFTLTPTDVVVTSDNFEDIIFDEVGDEGVDFTNYVRTYPKIFKRV